VVSLRGRVILIVREIFIFSKRKTNDMRGFWGFGSGFRAEFRKMVTKTWENAHVHGFNYKKFNVQKAHQICLEGFDVDPNLLPWKGSKSSS